MRPLVVFGDALLDRDAVGRVERVCPDAPVPVVEDVRFAARPGGAGLAALLARRDGNDVVLVTALAADPAGLELRGLLESAGIEVIDVGRSGQTPQKLRVRAAGRSLLRIDQDDGGDDVVGSLTDAARRVMAQARAVLVADYGRGMTRQLDALPAGVPVVWDPHPRGPEPLTGVTVATPNASEARHFAPGLADSSLAELTGLARSLRARWRAGAVTVTLGERGAILVADDAAPPYVVPAPAVPCFDPCGAGDRFSVSVTEQLADGALVSEAVTTAVAAAAEFVRDGGAAAIRLEASGAPTAPDVDNSVGALVQRVRATGGTVVAAGGCFDVLHAGHVAMLQSARRLGDCLVVLLNSDESVRRLKGAGRPVNMVADRAAVLAALECVDAVEVFDEPTPVTALERLRPQIFAKGADYALPDLPETAVLERWGGQVVVLPYLAGRSTTAIVKGASRGS
jgi:rfaE bifunctional protein nucleotidyltransferase chain/domain/rfaE bifunctional protein kinase chain/domain